MYGLIAVENAYFLLPNAVVSQLPELLNVIGCNSAKLPV